MDINLIIASASWDTLTMAIKQHTNLIVGVVVAVLVVVIWQLFKLIGDK